MDNYVNEGGTMEITATGAISAGDIVVTAETVGVAFEDIANTEKGNVAIEGVFRLIKNVGTAINEGDLVDFDTSVPEVTKGITPLSGDVENFGIAMETVGSSGERINVKLIPGGGTFA